ncbi:putative NCK-associated protein 1 [Blattamonas nauphoetae]|uniref:NCK-associated protein 1 n=1 Tax=Blattamonas nauphoetae TaxID=2049346 RepID=A0ABQ9Y756_9EUKA|nr:putative NCK-associated protein 1 [Blattamonas nauphoetae]
MPSSLRTLINQNCWPLLKNEKEMDQSKWTLAQQNGVTADLLIFDLQPLPVVASDFVDYFTQITRLLNDTSQTFDNFPIALEQELFLSAFDNCVRSLFLLSSMTTLRQAVLVFLMLYQQKHSSTHPHQEKLRTFVDYIADPIPTLQKELNPMIPFIKSLQSQISSVLTTISLSDLYLLSGPLSLDVEQVMGNPTEQWQIDQNPKYISLLQLPETQRFLVFSTMLFSDTVHRAEQLEELKTILSGLVYFPIFGSEVFSPHSAVRDSLKNVKSKVLKLDKDIPDKALENALTNGPEATTLHHIQLTKLINHNLRITLPSSQIDNGTLYPVQFSINRLLALLNLACRQVELFFIHHSRPPAKKAGKYKESSFNRPHTIVPLLHATLKLYNHLLSQAEIVNHIYSQTLANDASVLQQLIATYSGSVSPQHSALLTGCLSVLTKAQDSQAHSQIAESKNLTALELAQLDLLRFANEHTSKTSASRTWADLWGFLSATVQRLRMADHRLYLQTIDRIFSPLSSVLAGHMGKAGRVLIAGIEADLSSEELTSVILLPSYCVHTHPFLPEASQTTSQLNMILWVDSFVTNLLTNFRSHLSTYLAITVAHSCEVFSITSSTHSDVIDTGRKASQKQDAIPNFQMDQAKQEKVDSAVHGMRYILSLLSNLSNYLPKSAQTRDLGLIKLGDRVLNVRSMLFNIIADFLNSFFAFCLTKPVDSFYKSMETSNPLVTENDVKPVPFALRTIFGDTKQPEESLTSQLSAPLRFIQAPDTLHPLSVINPHDAQLAPPPKYPALSQLSKYPVPFLPSYYLNLVRRTLSLLSQALDPFRSIIPINTIAQRVLTNLVILPQFVPPSLKTDPPVPLGQWMVSLFGDAHSTKESDLTKADNVIATALGDAEIEEKSKTSGCIAQAYAWFYSVVSSYFIFQDPNAPVLFSRTNKSFLLNPSQFRTISAQGHLKSPYLAYTSHEISCLCTLLGPLGIECIIRFINMSTIPRCLGQVHQYMGLNAPIFTSMHDPKIQTEHAFEDVNKQLKGREITDFAQPLTILGVMVTLCDLFSSQLRDVLQEQHCLPTRAIEALCGQITEKSSDPTDSGAILEFSSLWDVARISKIPTSPRDKILYPSFISVFPSLVGWFNNETLSYNLPAAFNALLWSENLWKQASYNVTIGNFEHNLSLITRGFIAACYAFGEKIVDGGSDPIEVLVDRLEVTAGTPFYILWGTLECTTQHVLASNWNDPRNHTLCQNKLVLVDGIVDDLPWVTSEQWDEMCPYYIIQSAKKQLTAL